MQHVNLSSQLSASSTIWMNTLDTATSRFMNIHFSQAELAPVCVVVVVVGWVRMGDKFILVESVSPASLETVWSPHKPAASSAPGAPKVTVI